MATKSVIEIEIIDEQFKAFDAQLKAVQTILAKMPEQWKTIAKEVNEEQKAEKKTADEAEKARKKRLNQEKEFNKVLEDRKKSFIDAAHFTGNIAKNLASGALSIAKWTTFAAIGGGFGLGGLAANASDYRRKAQGLGTSTGDLRAAETNLGKYVDPNTVLSNIATLQHDITQGFFLNRLGGSKTGNPVDQLQTVMTNAIKDFKAHGQDINYAQNVGLTKIFSPEELIRLSSLSAEELDKTFKQLAKDRDKFKIDDAISRKWQDFWTQIGRAGQDIQVKLIDKLANLAQPLSDLSEAILKTIDSFLSDEKVAKWIDELAISVKDFGDYLKTDKFKKDVHDFVEGISNLATAIGKVARFFGLIKTTEEEKKEKDKEKFSNLSPTQQNAQIQLGNLNGANQKLLHSRDAENREKAYKFLLDKGINSEAAKGFLGGIQQESGFATKSSSWDWRTGTHVGIAQWDEKRQKAYRKAHGGNLIDASIEEQLNFLWEELNDKEAKAGNTLKSGLSKETGVTANLQFERPANEGTKAWDKEFGKRLSYASNLSVRNEVIINNATDTNVAVKSMTVHR